MEFDYDENEGERTSSPQKYMNFQRDQSQKQLTEEFEDEDFSLSMTDCQEEANELLYTILEDQA